MDGTVWPAKFLNDDMPDDKWVQPPLCGSSSTRACCFRKNAQGEVVLTAEDAKGELSEEKRWELIHEQRFLTWTNVLDFMSDAFRLGYGRVVFSRLRPETLVFVCRLR